jgi:multicomponent Na+:H+ antiporter subunit B
MRNLILKTATQYLIPLLLLFSIFLLLRGHYYPGGGFVGGLVASIAFVLHGFAFKMQNTLRLMRIHPFRFIPIGLCLAAISGLLPLFFGKPVLTGLWFKNPLPILGNIGTALLFDIGVYLVVIGVTLNILFTISESDVQ